MKSQGNCRLPPGQVNSARVIYDGTCEALCSKDSTCTGYVLTVPKSKLCLLKTQVGATGDGGSDWVCYMKQSGIYLRGP